jgi:histidinol dehydrogenase
VVRLSPDTAAAIAPVGIAMAEIEGLVAHKRALEVLVARLAADSEGKL